VPAIFVHLSDIHFGQERDEMIHIHTDVKEQLIADATELIRNLPGAAAHGILVTGDIAQAGKSGQYEQAGAWLDALAEAIRCPIFGIQMVPGNHDVDRDKLSVGATHVLDVIRKGGPTEYEKILSNPSDRASLFARFEDYGRFCEGYDCALDSEGRYATNLHVELTPGRSIRFIRMNSALLCTGDETEEEPELMVGTRQFTIPRTIGEEVVVLIHHPLNWFKDSEAALTYLRSRARVLISGHEHNPNVTIDKVEDGSDLMLLAAGATVPFKSDEDYTFTYNVMEFDWDEKTDALAVTIHPRAWNPKRTCFEADKKRLGSEDPRFTLGSPYFRKAAKPAATATAEVTQKIPKHVEHQPVIEMVPAADVNADVKKEAAMPPEVEGYRLVLLRFFRDLTEGERLRILIELDAYTVDSDERMTQAVERKLFDWLVRQGRIRDVERMIRELIENKTDKGIL
jgi:predicted MPP superfamily phosphohydrolase